MGDKSLKSASFLFVDCKIRIESQEAALTSAHLQIKDPGSLVEKVRRQRHHVRLHFVWSVKRCCENCTPGRVGRVENAQFRPRNSKEAGIVDDIKLTPGAAI